MGKRLNAWLKGKPAEYKHITNLEPDQEKAAQSSIEYALSRMGSLELPGNQLQSQIKPFDFKGIENSARANFMQNTVPTLAERFTSMGNTANSLSSPSFVSALGRSGAGLEGELARLAGEYGLRQQDQNLQQQSINQRERGLQSNNLFGLLDRGLASRFNNEYIPAQPGGAKKIFGGLVGAGTGYLKGGALGAIQGGLNGFSSAGQDFGNIQGNGEGYQRASDWWHGRKGDDGGDDSGGGERRGRNYGFENVPTLGARSASQSALQNSIDQLDLYNPRLSRYNPR